MFAGASHPPAPPAPPLPADSRAEFLAACPVSRETEARLERYAELLVERNQSLSLVSDSTVPVLWTRHFLDSAQLLRLIPEPENSVVDLGTGAGFPGLVLAIMGLPNVQLVEHNMQKVAFLKAVIDDLGLPVVIHAMKAEAVRPFAAGAVTSRALKPLDQLLGLARRFLGPDSVCVIPKGRRAEDELRNAQRNWLMDIERFQSLTDSGSTIFRLSHVSGAHA
jgi:16S rRNA (guanine527-N7)-methyltransferase